MNRIIFSDIEYVILIITCSILFIYSLQKKESIVNDDNIFDIKMSNVIKGIACIFILMAHYYTMQLATLSEVWSISKLVGRFAANIALVWFMFFSGYGITKSELKRACHFNEYLSKRVLKVYIPLIFISTIAVILYFLYPYHVTEDDILQYKLPVETYLANNFYYKNIFQLLIFSLGWIDWFIYCIVIFYIIFFISNRISKYTKITPTVILAFLLFIYYIITFTLLGEEHAHYYRLTWAFLLGNVVANYKVLTKKQLYIIITFCLLTFLNENIYQILSFIIGIISLFCIYKINKIYSIKGKILLFLGNLSFFYYLCHIRITYVLLYYLKIESVFLWAVINILVAFYMFKLYNCVSIKRKHEN